ncbi:hypothetical protein Y032_0183g958 [Ancylostoma ceylanicum]|uniref:TIL domain-containing protein n=1 Tax=Ancylostoma ceylanicum TaxID=53326 RepID=A0A016SST0_9BILA|nr:hypothetical protein Y032_0183g958 [Ancylostoma ceylanicum]
MDQFPLWRWNSLTLLLMVTFVRQHHSLIISGSSKVHGTCASLQCPFDTDCVEYKGVASCYNTTCPTDEVFSLCSSECEPTCGFINEECHKSCGPPACQCRRGFVRASGRCINPEHCPKNTVKTPSPDSDLIEQNDTPTTVNCSAVVCAPGHHCEAVGDQGECLPDTALSPTCALVDIGCLPGYHCEDTPTGMKCAPDSADGGHKPKSRLTCEQAKLPPVCSLGFHCEVISGNPECVPDDAPPRASQSSCALLDCPDDEYCEVFVDGPRCVATPGLCSVVFCATGQCVEYDGNFGCFETSCGLHEEFRKCATCEPTCEEKQKLCANKCHPPACQCIEGYVRHRGRCVKIEHCEKFENYGKFSKRFLQRP